MQHTTTTKTEVFNCIKLLCSFVDQRPGLDPNNYGGGLEGWRGYRRESAEITKDRSDFYELLRLALMIYDREELNKVIFDNLISTGDRLTLKFIGYENTPETEIYRLEYITGQYWPTEYRPAASRSLVSAIWKYYQSLERLQTGHDIRKEARKHLSRRVGRLYFN